MCHTRLFSGPLSASEPICGARPSPKCDWHGSGPWACSSSEKNDRTFRRASSKTRRSKEAAVSILRDMAAAGIRQSADDAFDHRR